MLTGVLLAESLRVGIPLAVPGLRVTSLHREDVSQSSGPQPAVWTFVEFEAPDDAAPALAESLAVALLAEGGWYADFAVGGDHVVVFAGRVFRYRAGDAAGREAATAHGRAVGVPEHQLDWPD